MWAATTALNGIIGVGVPQDWTTHMIGHELTSQYGIAHGRTLAIVLPYLLKKKDPEKRQTPAVCQRSWNIQDGTDDEKIDLAINNTESFFNSLGIVTKLSTMESMTMVSIVWSLAWKKWGSPHSPKHKTLVLM